MKFVIIGVVIILTIFWLITWIVRAINYLLITSSKEVSMYRCPKCGMGIDESFLQYVFLWPEWLFPWSKLKCSRCGYKAVRLWMFWK